MPPTRQPPTPCPHPALGLPFLLPCWCTGLGLLGITPSEPSCPPYYLPSQGLLSEEVEGLGAGDHLDPVLKVTEGVGRSYCLYPFLFPLPLPGTTGHKRWDPLTNVSNVETNFNPVLSDTYFWSHISGDGCGQVEWRRGAVDVDMWVEKGR